MPDPKTFEARLADAFERYVAPAPVSIDALAFTRELAVATSARSSRWPRSTATIFGRRLVVLVAVALLVLATLAAIAVGSALLDRPAPHPFAGEVERTGPLLAPRMGAALAVLGDGRVLVAGGSDGGEGEYGYGEIWDPSTHAFTKAGRGSSGFVAIALADGRLFVLSFGGSYSVYDPATGTSATWCCMDFQGHPAAALLADGRILVVGLDSGGDEASTRLFDPATGTVSSTGLFTAERSAPQAISLQDGRVLVLGGGPSGAELYDPATRAFTPTDPPGLLDLGPAVLLSDGRVLVPGTKRFEQTADAVVYDPARGRFESAAPVPNHVAAAVALDDGQAMLVGDHEGAAAGDGTFAVVYDPEAGVTQDLPPPTAYHPSVVRLPDGRVLLAGGYDIDGGAALDVAEIYR